MKAFIEIADKEHSERVIINIKQIVYINERKLYIRMSDGLVIHTSYDDMLTILNTISG